MKKYLTKSFALVLTFALLLGLLPMGDLPLRAHAAEDNVYVLDVTKEVTKPIASYSMEDGQTMTMGTDGYFTLVFAAKTKIDGSDKEFEDGYTAEMRINFQTETDVEKGMVPAIEFTTAGPATIKLWWVAGGDDRQMAIYDESGNILTKTDLTVTKNSLYISELTVPAAGFYYLGVPDGSNYIFKIEVTETPDPTQQVEPLAWDQVALPVITAVEDTGEGQIKATVRADLGNAGGDELLVLLLDEEGNVVSTRRSSLRRPEHILRFEPEVTGQYTLRAVLKRKGQEDKYAAQDSKLAFYLPLEEPAFISATSKGGGAVELVWTPIPEVEHYEIYSGDTLIASTAETTFLAEGLTVDEKYTFTVFACRGAQRVSSQPITVTASANARYTWSFTYYGPSTNAEKNGYEGNLNEDGAVTVYSEGNRGKVVESGPDGLAFYYTAIPTTLNFTLRAKVTVDSWKLSNAQEGFGLLVTDRLGEHGNTGNLWNNQYMAAAGKVEYYYDSEAEEAHWKEDLGNTEGYVRYSMKLGLGAMAETGLTPENLAKIESGDTDAIKNYFRYSCHSLEWNAGLYGKQPGTYSVIGNHTTVPDGNLEQVQLTEFILEIQKNNTGYFITYYDAEGNILAQKKYYEPEALSQLDPDFVYVGFFAARNARATFSQVELTTIEKEKDAPAQEKPVEKVQPLVSIGSATVSQSTAYRLVFLANVDGTARIRINDRNTDIQDIPVKAGQQVSLMIDITADEITKLDVVLTPDPDQDLGADRVLSGLGAVSTTVEVLHSSAFEQLETIYVAPNGYSTGSGTPEKPLDIYTAVDVARPGQTILLLEGTYLLTRPIKIQRGMDGTAQLPIRMIADPNAKSRPVLDFQRLSAGIVHGGNHWFFSGFDVTNTQNKQKGFQVSGNNNVLEDILAYYNGDTGIQISRYSGTFDLDITAWPANNLVRNCTSYCNYDAGFEDADGFAAKLTCGEGNVFDGCVAYNNADDGWDLYAKLATGSIGSVTIRNCVAYSNGFVPGVEGQGNGNGFKLGGEGLSGKHVLENSYAFFNLASGIDSNNCPDVIIRNCVSYNNGKYNISLRNGHGDNTDFYASDIISFKDAGCVGQAMAEGDNLKGEGSQKTEQYINATTYYWNGSSCQNTAGEEFTADLFVSTEFKGVARKADGSIDLQGFLILKSDAPVDEPTNPTEPTTPPVAEPADSSPTVLIVSLVVLAAAAVAVVLFLKKKKQ